ncbi:hypothetical protein SAMN05216302_10383 [Nitrosomonas aestuarii]|uniref:Uncharacterized protein n=2 Tax=Nitrosomonas aestuarii TaxID=52441 RepID=A0A1I4FHI9_9PROT|nr:hypothetical protein SAMN05216302_10383 [Nitrosomonas aestuarii]
MNRFFSVNFMVFMLLVSYLTNGFASAFYGEVFMHELEHNHQHSLSTANAEHSHNEFPDDEKELDLSRHICFSVVYQPLLFTKLPLIPSVAGKEILSESITFQIPTSIPDSPFRPPRNIFPS